MWRLLPIWFWACSLGASSEPRESGAELFRQKKYEEAIAALEASAASEKADTPEYRESMVMIGQSYFMLSQAPKAIPWLEKAPGSTEANYMLGYAYLQNGQAAQSEAAFARLFNLNPESAAGHLLAAQMMLKKEFEKEAVDEIAKALAIDPKLPNAHFILGEIAITRGRVDEGIEELRKELSLNPNSSMAWYRLGDAYQRRSEWDAAIPNLERAVWLNQDFSGPYILLGKCYFKVSNYSNAEGILKRALALDPNNRAALYLLGQTLTAEGRTEEARAVLDKLKGLLPQQ